MTVLINILIQLAIAALCAAAATLLIPRRIPGKFFGLILIGWLGIWVGQWISKFLATQYGISFAWLQWSLQGVALIPALIGSMIVLYVFTAFLSWGRYGR